MSICHHILANVFQRLVETYEGSLAELCSAGVILQSLYQQLKGAGGFRNVLVHEYLEVDLTKWLTL
ncbi:MAG: HepT-like ribonuclease domain-containing protein [Candidatus Bathyarchaeia archaeon]